MIARGVYTMAALLFALAAQAPAQIIRQPIGTPRLPPAPAPVMSSINQTQGAIWPQIWFQVPDGTTGIRVSRQPAGGTWSLITPTTVPLSTVPTPTGQYYYWTDNTLAALGAYNYSVTGVLADGRMATSSPMAYSPIVNEPSSVAVTKPNPWTAVITFLPSKWPAQTYRLYGTGLAPIGAQASGDPNDPRTNWSVTLTNLAAGTYHWVLKAEYAPGIRTTGVPVSVTLP